MNRDIDLLRRLLRAKDHMDQAPQKPWSITSLARISGTSEAHFARSFRQAFGIPPHRYLLTRRVERAAALLRDTDLPVIDIAMHVGWESIGTFGRTFRDILGETPTKMRRRLRKDVQALEQVPHCFLSAAQRPHLKIAVSEKRRQSKADRQEAQETEAS